jgi:hypothetical protein
MSTIKTPLMVEAFDPIKAGIGLIAKDVADYFACR